MWNAKHERQSIEVQPRQPLARWSRLLNTDRFLPRRHIPASRLDIQLAHTFVFAFVHHILALHLTDGFLAISLPAVIAGLFEITSNILDAHCLRPEVRAAQLVRRVGIRS